MKQTVPKGIKINGSLLKIVQGDLVTQNVEAIVNAANPAIEGGGGVDGRIHHVAGPALSKACRDYKKQHQIKEIQVGDAIITESFNIQNLTPTIRFVIHTVGPDCRIAGQWEEREELLESAYINALELAKMTKIATLAFPAISTGAYNYPFWEAQTVVVQVIKEYLKQQPKALFDEVRLVYFSDNEFENAVRVFEEYF